jgi:hypothetical protein
LSDPFYATRQWQKQRDEAAARYALASELITIADRLREMCDDPALYQATTRLLRAQEDILDAAHAMKGQRR